MTTPMPGNDIIWTTLTALGLVLLMLAVAGWLIDHALLPALRGLAPHFGRDRWPVLGRHATGSPGPEPADPGNQAGTGPGDHPDDEHEQARDHMADWASGRFTHVGEEDDDTATLAIFADANAERLVPAHEPSSRMCEAHPDDCPLGPEPHAFVPPEAHGPCCCRQPWEDKPADPPGPDRPPQGEQRASADGLKLASAGPGELDAIHAYIEAHRQQTVVDPEAGEGLAGLLTYGGETNATFMRRMADALRPAGAQ